MGLDIGFIRAEAIKAGLELKTISRNANYHHEDDEDYIEWASEIIEVMLVPNALHCVEVEGSDVIFVRANKWGRTYKPLTDWLKANNIQWTES